MKLLIFTVAFVIACVDSAFAQQNAGTITENRIVVGETYKKGDDKFVLSFPVTGNTTNIGYSFIQASQAKKSTIGIDGNFGSLSGRNATEKIQSFDLRLAQGFSLLKSRDGKINNYWGYSLNANPTFMRVLYKDDTRYSWATSNDLSIYQSFVYTSGRNRLTWDIYVPVIGISSRPPDKSSDHNTMTGLMYDSYSNLFFTSWNNRKSISSSLDLKRTITRQLSVVIGGRFEYNNLKRDNLYKETEAGIYAGISFSVK